MSNKSTDTAVVIPSWNGVDEIGPCLDSLLAQTQKAEIIVVENGSTDGSLEFLQKNYPNITLLIQEKNLGFAGGVNVGIQHALDKKYKFIALFNNDAIADKDWLKNLVAALQAKSEYGIAACKFMTIDKSHLDSTGDIYTSWGLVYPRGRNEEDLDAYDALTEVFAASGGSSLYRAKTLNDIGLFDKDFFAYYEDIDISFRAQLAGWKVCFVPTAKAYHKIGATSGKVAGFTTKQTIKNIPWIFWKNVPRGRLFWIVGPRLFFAHTLFFWKAIFQGKFKAALSGLGLSLLLLPKKLGQRSVIQRNKRVDSNYIASIMTWDLPPNAEKLRSVRAGFRRLFPRRSR